MGTLPGLLNGGLVTPEGHLTAADLDLLSRRAAATLAAAGIGPGDTVGVWLPNGAMWVALLFACARRGAIAVSLNTRYRSAEVGDILRRAGCRVLALDPAFKAIDFAGILAAVPPEDLATVETVIVPAGDAPLPGRRVVTWAQVQAAAPGTEDLSRPDAPVATFTTSGTTSRPKLVLHDQGTLVRHARAVAAAHGFGAGPSLQALPFCGIFGFCQMLAALHAGVDTLAPPSFDPDVLAAMALRHRPSHCYGSDEMGRAFIKALPEPLQGLRLFGFAAFSPALGDLPERAAALGVPMRGLYGMSECQALFSLQPPGATETLGGGVPVDPDTVLRVRDPETNRLLEAGEKGALEIKGPSLFLRYLGDAPATAAAFTDDGFFRTGDLAELTAGGGFIFHGRLGDAVRLGGFLVSPSEIETYIEAHPGVDACVVVTAASGERLVPVAFIIGCATEAEVRTHCKTGLAGYKVPARVVQCEAFPTTAGPNGSKVQRHFLRQRAAELLEPQELQKRRRT